MTTASQLLVDGYGRVHEEVLAVLDGLSSAQLAFRVDDTANPIGWLVWHLTRVQDDHLAEAAGVQQRWTEAGWVDRFGLPFEPDATGYGQGRTDVGRVAVDASLLAGYHEAVYGATTEFLRRLSDADFDRVVDTRWDPPVTLGVRFVSVLSDDLQHVGQAAYVRGIIERR
ncbi:MAG: mycothiol transferase [Acidimicrobiales bacterium]